MSHRLAVDIGGGSTDLLLADEATGDTHLLKIPSNPDNPSTAVATGMRDLLERAGVGGAQIGSALLSGAGAADALANNATTKVGLLVTEGFEHVLHLAGPAATQRVENASIPAATPSFADLEFVRGVRERLNARGDVLTALDEDQARAAIRDLLAGGVEAIAISLIHAYANPTHESRLRALIDELRGRTDIPVLLSSELMPWLGEPERALAMVANAYLRPRMQQLLDDLAQSLIQLECTAELQIARADGTTMSAKRAVNAALPSVLSSAACASHGAARAALSAGHGEALVVAIGGAATTISVVENGEPVLARTGMLGEHPIKLTAVAVHNTAIGGNSIAKVPASGALRIGSEQTAATIGPAGMEATVTDAQLVLGRLPAAMLDGQVALDSPAAEQAVAKLGSALGLDTYQAAQAIIDLANENMLGALHQVCARRRTEPGDFALVAVGAAGPLHGNALAMATGCYPVIVPPAAGAGSAYGLLDARPGSEFTTSFVRTLDEIDAGQLADILFGVGGQAAAQLEQDGVAEADRQLRYEIDIRYLRQSRLFTLVVDPANLAGGRLLDIARELGSAFERRYGFKPAAAERLDSVELVNARAIGRGPRQHIEWPRHGKTTGDGSQAVVEQQRVYFDGSFTDCKIYQRSQLAAGNRVSGPAVIAQHDTTTLVHPQHVAEVDEFLNILIAAENPATQRGDPSWQ